MQNGNRQVTVFYVCALSLWEWVGVRASGLTPFISLRFLLYQLSFHFPRPFILRQHRGRNPVPQHVNG